MHLLLMSSSRVDGTGYLEHAHQLIKSHLGDTRGSILFIPYAGVTIGFDDYETMVSSAFTEIGYAIQSIHHQSDPVAAVEAADAIVIGGGNTFNLLYLLQQKQLIEPIRHKVLSGTPYIGWSAGSNIAAPSIKTTNDMPIIAPASFNALNLVPFQINPHYIDGNPPGHQGETREQRLNEYLQLNPAAKVLGIAEGTALTCHANDLNYHGNKPAFLFDRHGKHRVTNDNQLKGLL